MAALRPSPSLIERFRTDLEALTGGAPPSLAVAVSGGPDSLALLLLATAAWPERVRAATVDHGLREGSAGEALMVRDLCARIGCPHDILTVSVSARGDGLQAAAREARYEALGGWASTHGATHLATAHHADDQAETLMMRLQRGSGAGGLAGIRPIRREGAVTLIRPLLGWTKEALTQIVAKARIVPVDDPSNRDPRFDRTAARRLLAAHPELDPAALARSAAALGEADDALRWAADRLWQERASREGNAISLDTADLPPELRRRLVARALAEFGGSGRGEEIGRLIEALGQGRTATLAGVKALAAGQRWRFEPAPPRKRR